MNYLFSKWGTLSARLKNKNILLLLDYDGTLVPITDTPDKAMLSAKAKKLLRDIAAQPRMKIAIVSGRSLEDIKKRVGLEGVIFVGNHGSEIEGPKIKFKSLISRRYRLVLDEIKADLSKRLSGIKGVLLEDKGFSVAVHFRMAAKGQIPRIKTTFHEAIIHYLVRNKISVKKGKMVLEAKLPSGWDKGRVVLWLLARHTFVTDSKDIVPVYIGDDNTDEDAFLALKERGVSIFVGKPRNSAAGFYLNNSEEVIELLERLLRLAGENKE